MKRKILLALIFLAGAGVLLFSCGIEKPEYAEGRCVLALQAIDTSGAYTEEWLSVPNAQIEVVSSNPVFKRIYATDESGRVVIEGLASGDYFVQASMRDTSRDILFTGQERRRLKNEDEVEDTLQQYAALAQIPVTLH